MVEKKPRPTKEMSAKLFTGANRTSGRSVRPVVSDSKNTKDFKPASAGGGTSAKKNFELKGQEAGLVRSTDVFSEGAAFGSGEKAAPIVDWDALANHARTANRPLTLGEIFSRDRRYYFISRPILITLTAGILGGLAVCAFGYLTDRIAYDRYSDKGYELLHNKNPRPAVEYFLSQAGSTESNTFSGSPYHIAALEALAESYDRDKCYNSADETYKKEIKLLLNAPIKDDIRVSMALERYGRFLAAHDRPTDAEAVNREVKRLAKSNTGSAWIWFFAILTFAFEGIYMSGVLLSDKSRLENWPVYGGFTLLGMFGIAVGMFKLGCPIAAALGVSMGICYVALPSVLVLACAVGKNTPAFHVLLPSRKRK